MEKHWLERTELLIKKAGINKLLNSHVLVIGMGGVGSFASEFLARAGIGKMTIIDGDVVDTTNRNRQLHALSSTVGLSKVELMANRIKDIHPEIQLTAINEFITPERAIEILQNDYDYVVECIDSLTPKLYIIQTALNRGLKIISSMGAGGKIDASKVKITKLSKTRDCPLAKYVRKRLKKMGVKKNLKVVYSYEIPDKTSIRYTDGSNFKKSFYGTISYIPALFGLMAANAVILDLLNE
jgi:tRNA A37 threonylcarbamoyladenosine dehydratase